MKLALINLGAQPSFWVFGYNGLIRLYNNFINKFNSKNNIKDTNCLLFKDWIKFGILSGIKGPRRWPRKVVALPFLETWGNQIAWVSKRKKLIDFAIMNSEPQRWNWSLDGTPSSVGAQSIGLLGLLRVTFQWKYRSFPLERSALKLGLSKNKEQQLIALKRPLWPPVLKFVFSFSKLISQKGSERIFNSTHVWLQMLYGITSQSHLWDPQIETLLSGLPTLECTLGHSHVWEQKQVDLNGS